MTQPGILMDIQVERRRQDEKWGVQNHGDRYWLPILMEEVGEIARSLLERGEADGEEILQVAAVAVAWLECKGRNSNPPKVDKGQTSIDEQIATGRALEGLA